MSEAEPAVSVVIASVSGQRALPGCLEALARQQAPPATEILVVSRYGVAAPELSHRLLQVRWIVVEPTASLPAMRAAGMQAARAPVIGVLGEHLRAGPSWLRAAAQTGSDGRAVVGGPIDAGELRRLSEWAFLFAEYARFLPSANAGPVPALAGSNCTYERGLLERLGTLSQGKVWDARLHGSIRAQGIPLHSDPALSARCEKRLGFRLLVAQRYHCGRASAAERAAAWPPAKRLAFAAATPLLPGLLLFRIARALLERRRHGARLAWALPALSLAALCGAYGEAVGALRGAGSSRELAE